MKKFKAFNVGNFVMVRICPERFPPVIVKKLHFCSSRPFKILKKLNDKAYVIDYFKIFGIRFTFNVEILVDYKGFDFNPNNPLVDEPSLSYFLRTPHFSYSKY